jgi:hypothetical protein
VSETPKLEAVAAALARKARRQPDLLTEPPFIVLRAARGVPPGWMPADREGTWYNRADLLAARDLRADPAMAVALPTDRIEHREDGATAQVWEVHPPGGNYANDGDEGDWRP